MKKKRIKIMLERPGMDDGFNALTEWVDVEFDDETIDLIKKNIENAVEENQQEDV